VGSRIFSLVPISNNDIRKISRLSRLELSPEEMEKLSLELAQIVSFFDQIKAVDTRDIEIETSMTGTHNKMREDKVRPSLPQSAALDNATNKKEGFFVVPKVIS